MKKTFLLLAMVFLPMSFFGQENIGKKDVSDWALFSGNVNKPQYKKIDDKTFFAYYRTSPNDSGIMVFDKNLNVLKNIGLKLTDNKTIIFNTKALDALMSYPTYYYRKDNNSVVIIGNIKLSRSDYAVVGLTYSLETEVLIQIDTLRYTKSNDFFVRLSADDNYFMVGEQNKKDRTSDQMQYDVFRQDCTKQYTVSIDVPSRADSYSILSNSGEIIHSYTMEEGREITYKFSKFDSQGNLAGTAMFAPSKDDIYDYQINDFLLGASNVVYCVSSKVRKKMEGIAILKIEFDKGTCAKILDKIFDKPELEKIYRNAELSHSMINDSRLKPLKSFDHFSINSAFIDNDGIYLTIENLKLTTRGSRRNQTFTYSSEDIILLGLNLDGSEKWITPIRRDAFYTEGKMNFFTPTGSGIRVSSYESDKYIGLIVPSMDMIYATRIDKKTGKAIVPIPLITEKTATNTNSILWFDSNEVVITTMKGIYFVLSKNEINLHSIRIAY